MMNRTIRRKDMEISSKEEMEAIIRETEICRLGMADESGPYIVPLNFGYENGTVYFHSAKAGRKLDVIRKNPSVCLEFTSGIEIIIREDAKKSDTKYRCVLAAGTAAIVDDADVERKRHALQVLMRQYSRRDFTITDPHVHSVSIIEVRIDSMTGKVNR